MTTDHYIMEYLEMDLLHKPLSESASLSNCWQPLQSCLITFSLFRKNAKKCSHLLYAESRISNVYYTFAFSGLLYHSWSASSVSKR